MGNAALKFIPTGGLYVTGGLTPKNLHLIKGMDTPFIKAYLDKGRMTPLCESIPLFAVLSEDIGLRGARVCAERVSLFEEIMFHFQRIFLTCFIFQEFNAMA